MITTVERERPQGALDAADIRVLVVEDDAEMRASLREAFTLRGFTVATSPDGMRAVDAAFRGRYDVIVSDIRMPGMSGIALARSLKSLPRAPHVILITAYPEWHVLKEAHEAGVFDIVRKPLSLRRLADRVAEWAVSRKAWRSDEKAGRLVVHADRDLHEECEGEDVILRPTRANRAVVLWSYRCDRHIPSGCDGIPLLQPGDIVSLPDDWRELPADGVRFEDLKFIAE